MFKIKSCLGYLSFWCSACDCYHSGCINKSIRVLGKRLYFTSIKDFSSAENYLSKNGVLYEVL